MAMNNPLAIWHSKMTHTFGGGTMTELHNGLCQAIIEAPPVELDMITSVDVQFHNCQAFAESMEWEFDLKTMWLTKSRWTKMVRQYLDPQELTAWLDQIETHIGSKNRGIAMLRTNTVDSVGGEEFGNKQTRRWGSCILAISFKVQPWPQITLYSRTSYLGYLSAMDLSVAWMAGRYVSDRIGIPLKDFRFQWYNEAFQWHSFKSLAYLFNHPRHEEYEAMVECRECDLDDPGILEYITPALRISRNWLQQLLDHDDEMLSYDDMSFNTYRRIRRRYHTEHKGIEYAKRFTAQTPGRNRHYKEFPPLPSVSIHDLDFSPIGLPRRNM